jgi:hypothetical protein
MKLVNYCYRATLLLAILFLLSACGGGGGDGGNAESMLAPYLISSPQVSFTPNLSYPGQFDVTVTIEADGPNGIYSASVWLIDVNDSSNSYFMDLTASVANTWTATTNSFIPLAAGTYKVDTITLYDADPFGASYLTGWYFEMPLLSSSHYYVDQRDVYNNPEFNMIAFGVSSTPITRFTMP